MPPVPGEPYRRLLARLEAVRTLGVSLGLERVRRALERLGSPERQFVSVQIAGTNGKGSTAAMTDAILRAAGLRTGLFTSPHLCRFTERIRIDGREVDGDRLAAWDQEIVAAGIPLTYFEVATVLAFAALAAERVDAGVLETGLGGRLDATTVVAPVATAITSVGLDHTDLLGATLGEIAAEKAGIARSGIPLYLGPLPAEADQVVTRIAAAAGAPVRRFGEHFAAPGTPLALGGAHQVVNAALAVALAEEAARACGRALPAAAVAAGLAHTVWPGRLEWGAPDVLLDCAHNADGAAALAAALPAARPRALVASVLRGKDAAGIMSALGPRFDLVVATRARSERALDPEELAAAVPRGAAPIEIVADPERALARARAFLASRGGGPVVVAGSIFLVGELRAHLLGEPCDPIPTGDPLP
jgi:dihydrofolate synthase / folylpolyglutamate synthase